MASTGVQLNFNGVYQILQFLLVTISIVLVTGREFHLVLIVTSFLPLEAAPLNLSEDLVYPSSLQSVKTLSHDHDQVTGPLIRASSHRE